jgi:DeoR family transcriptional regulator, ulaG and ulaABCDEF operon transcriptional repressor
MLAAERDELILRVLREARYATVGRIAELTSTSEATIRRDLWRLEKSGQVHRVRGGARLAEDAAGTGRPAELPFDDRTGILREAKRRIARAAAGLCAEGETILIDGGSTTFLMTEFLLAARLQVITNSFAIAASLVGRFAGTVILGGGIVYPESQLVLDPFGEEAFRNYTASKLFMGVYGIDETGATNTEALLIKTERAMIERARELVILADSSKFDRRGGLFLCGFDRICTVITDPGIPDRARELLASRGVKLVVA